MFKHDITGFGLRVGGKTISMTTGSPIVSSYFTTPEPVAAPAPVNTQDMFKLVETFGQKYDPAKGIAPSWYWAYFHHPGFASIRQVMTYEQWLFGAQHEYAANITDAQKSSTLDKVVSTVKQSIVQPLKSVVSNVKADVLLLQGRGSESRKVRRQAFEQLGSGISASLQPLKQLDIVAKQLVPEKYRKYAVGPGEVLEMSTRPEEFSKNLYRGLRIASARPVYHLAGKLFGYEKAAYFMPFDVKPSDIGIKEGTPEAAEFTRKSMQGSNVVMSVIGTIYPAVGLAWALYITAKTIEDQKKAEKLLNESLDQALAKETLEQQKQQAELRQQQAELDSINAQLKALEAQSSQTNAAIEVAAEGNSNIVTPKQNRTKAVLTVGAGAAAIAYMMTQ